MTSRHLEYEESPMSRDLLSIVREVESAEVMEA